MHRDTLFSRCVDFFIQHKVVTFFLVIAVSLWGVHNAPFDWSFRGVERNPVPVDAIPDVGENQQIVFVDWMGRSAADIEEHVTRPLTTAMLGVSGVKTVRGSSMSGMSSVYVIFDEKLDFHATRARVMEKLASLPQGALPAGVQPALGPDASPLGQVFWYTIEGLDGKTGERIGGWELTELREIQDRLVKPALSAAPGIAEVAAVGHGTSEYRIELDPDKMRERNITMPQIYQVLEKSGDNLGVGTFEINGVEYFIRALGAFQSVGEIENTVVGKGEGGPVRIGDLGRVHLTLAGNMGGLDRFGDKAVGGVAVARYGENPLEAIRNLRERIAQLAPSLPEKTLPDGRVSKATLVPFYERSQLIGETLYTLSSAIRQQILITVVVIVFMLINLRAGLIVSLLMPLSVLICFILMRRFGVDANLVSLSGIAIAIGTISDMGIILCENIINRLRTRDDEERSAHAVLAATVEVGSAVMTAVATTIVGFLPVFALTGPEGKLFKPLAYTKTFCLIAAIAVTLVALPALAHLLLAKGEKPYPFGKWLKTAAALGAGLVFFYWGYWLAGCALVVLAAWLLFGHLTPESYARRLTYGFALAAGLAFGLVLAGDWMPLGPGVELWKNALFTWGLLLGVYGLMELFIYLYPTFIAFFLDHKLVFLALPLCLCLLGATAWLGFERVFGIVPKAAGLAGARPDRIRAWEPWVYLAHKFPGLGKEFMPSFDEGTFLYMPTVMPHASPREIESLINLQDRRFAEIPEVYDVAGKYGRAESALDPAPLSMFETVISYHPEYAQDEVGRILTFAFDPAGTDVFRTMAGEPVMDGGKAIPTKGRFFRDNDGKLIPDANGRPYRQWRPRIRTVGDLWKEVEKAGAIPGITGAPKLYPIEARMVMLQTGIRAPMGIKIQGDNLEHIQKAADAIEHALRRAPGVNPAAVAADRSLGRPYWEILPKRDALAARGIAMYNFEHFLEVAIAGTMTPAWLQQDRTRIPVRPRYAEAFRSGPEELAKLPVPSPDGKVTPLGELADFRFVQGPEMIASEGSRLVAYVVFDRQPGLAEVEAVESARDWLLEQRRSGQLALPDGVSYSFAGSYENQVRSEKVFAVILPAALAAIFLIIYLQFRSMSVTFILFAGVPLALSGGMILLWLYGQDWFLGHTVLGVDLRELFHVRAYNLSVAVWVGFLALFGIATDDGVVMATYLEQTVAHDKPATIAEARAAVIKAGMRRVRPCLMTTATTILALLPVLTSGGRGSEIMIPMAIPSFGGMLLAMITMFVVPVFYSWMVEGRVGKNS